MMFESVEKKIEILKRMKRNKVKKNPRKEEK